MVISIKIHAKTCARKQNYVEANCSRYQRVPLRYINIFYYYYYYYYYFIIIIIIITIIIILVSKNV